MEFLSIVLLVVIIVLISTHKTNLNRKITNLEVRLLEMQRMLKQNLESRAPADKPIAKPVPVIRQADNVSEVKKPDFIPAPTPPATKSPAPNPVAAENIERQEGVISDPMATIRRPVRTYIPTQEQKPKEPQLSFFERHPDLEKFIGENLINKIGIAILVLAIAYFVKYAIDNNWVGPIGRVGIGILCGGILIAIAHRMRSTYKAFSSVLVGGGLAIFYFTITLAFHQFHLFNQLTSFIILIVITCFAVVLSLLYDRQELAVIAIIGGLASPFMVSTGNANYHGLFIYLIILNAGLLIIAYNKLWRILNIVSFALTVVVVAAVIKSLTAATYSIGFVYVSILYLMFFAINVANNVRQNKQFIGSDFTILLSNTALYFGAGLYLLTAMHHEQYRGLFSASLAAVNLVLSFVLFKSKKADPNILYLMIGITLSFISLTAPIQLHGHYITMFWVVESVLLFWLYLKSGIKLMKLASLLVWSAMLISIFIDWSNVYSASYKLLPVIVNKGFITTVIAAVSTYLLYRFVKQDQTPGLYSVPINANVFKVASIAFLFISGFLEINHQYTSRYPETSLNTLYLMLYVPAFVYVFYMLSKQIKSIELNATTNTALISLCIIIYLIFTPSFFNLQYDILVNHKASSAHFAAHWVGAVFVALLVYQLIVLIKNNTNTVIARYSSWVIAATVVTFLSLELCLGSNLLFYKSTITINHIQTVYIKTALPVLWGLLSFALMWLGMRYKMRTFRIISLTLFSITLLKLFLFDIKNIPPAGKIAAFFCLGVLLLIISFMYQKVKKIIADDENK